jgi:hypothetical protein
VSFKHKLFFVIIWSSVFTVGPKQVLQNVWSSVSSVGFWYYCFLKFIQ